MSKNVFLADMAHIEVITPGDPFSYPGQTRGYFHVRETFKGSADNIPYFDASEFPSTMCDMNIKQGASYYVFAENDGALEYGMCSLNTRAERLPYYTEVLRKLKSNTPPEMFSGIYKSEEDILVLDTGGIIEVLELRLYGHKNYKVSFEGYTLHDGRILAMKVIDSSPM